MDPCNKPKHVNLHRCSTLLSHIVSFLSVQHFQGKDIQMFLVKVRAAMILVPLGTGRNILLSTRADRVKLVKDLPTHFSDYLIKMLPIF